MFKKSRRNIVAVIMSILIIIYLGTLGIIYFSSYHEVFNRNRDMLRQFVTFYPDILQQPKDMPGEKMPKPPLQEAPAFKLAVFYSVEISYNGDIIKINNGMNGIFTDKELEKIAVNIVKKGKKEGVTESLIYKTADKGSYILVGFMDNTLIEESMTTLFRYTLIFGGIAVICLFALAVFLAEKIVSPLEESYKKQRQFISDAGHELKTPIAVINANAELLSRKFNNNQWIENIKYENERMGDLVGQLLELAKTENISAEKEKLDFSRLVESEVLPFESNAFEKGIILKCDIKEVLYVFGNSIQLKQLVSILIDNALSHSKSGGEILIQLKKEKNLLKLLVANDGEIPSGQIKEIFERFYRTDTARSGEGGHYGIGLAIAKAIVTSHGGKIEAMCKHGKVIFIVSLPAKK